MTRSRHKKNNPSNNDETSSTSLPDVHQFNHIQYWGYGLIIFIYTAAEYAQEWESLKYLGHPFLEPNVLLYILRVIFFVELVIFIVRWIIATINELELWANSELNWSHWTKNPFEKQNTYSAIFGLAVFLGLLLAFSNKIFVAASILSIYSLFGYWTQWLCNNYFSHSINETKIKNEKHLKRITIMKHYWLEQPQLARIATVMFFSLISVIFATAALFQSEQKDSFEIAAYVILILDILIAETYISKWRIKRDRELKAVSYTHLTLPTNREV